MRVSRVAVTVAVGMPRVRMLVGVRMRRLGLARRAVGTSRVMMVVRDDDRPQNRRDVQRNREPADGGGARAVHGPGRTGPQTVLRDRSTRDNPGDQEWTSYSCRLYRKPRRHSAAIRQVSGGDQTIVAPSPPFNVPRSATENVPTEALPAESRSCTEFASAGIV